jgi:hypothetical protein
MDMRIDGGPRSEARRSRHPAPGQFTYTQGFSSIGALDENNSSAKLLATFDVAVYEKYQSGGGKLWNLESPGYNSRIELTCGQTASPT